MASARQLRDTFLALCGLATPSRALLPLLRDEWDISPRVASESFPDRLADRAPCVCALPSLGEGPEASVPREGRDEGGLAAALALAAAWDAPRAADVPLSIPEDVPTSACASASEHCQKTSRNCAQQGMGCPLPPACVT